MKGGMKYDGRGKIFQERGREGEGEELSSL